MTDLQARILAWVQNHQGATLDEIATGLRMTAPQARSTLVDALARLRNDAQVVESARWYARTAAGDHPRTVAGEHVRAGRAACRGGAP